jgi:hypothetical protein
MQQRGKLADSDLRLQPKPFIYRGFIGVGSQSFTGIFTGLAARSETGHCTVNARPLLANATDALAGTLITMSETMKQAFGLVRRPWGVFYLKHKITGEQKSLKTSDKHEAQRILQAHNESESQPHNQLFAGKIENALRDWHQAGADSLRRGNRGHLETASGGGAALSLPAYRARWRPGNGI